MADDPSGSDQPEPFNPFSAFPMFGDIAKALQGQGPLNWDAARQFALLGASQGHAEPNVDPSVRIAYADLARIAGMHVNDVTNAGLDFPEPRVLTRSQWAGETLDAYRPLFTDLATSLGSSGGVSGLFGGDGGDDETGDPMFQMLAGLSQMMAPAMLGMAVGSMVGALAQRVFGLHDLPIPRDKSEVVLVDATIQEFASEWSIPLDQMRLWVVAHELVGYRVFELAHVVADVRNLVRAYAGGFRPAPSAIADKLGGIDVTGDNPFEAVQQAFGDPEVLLGAVRSPEQEALQPRLDAAVAAVVGYTDWMVDAVAVRIVGGEALTIAEAVRRHRIESSTDDVFVERLLGIRVGDGQVRRGKAFVQGVVDRVGEAELNRLIEQPDSVPTPAELDAPGLWIARVGE